MNSLDFADSNESESFILNFNFFFLIHIHDRSIVGDDHFRSKTSKLPAMNYKWDL